MSNVNARNQIAAIVAAFISATIFIAASIGPAIQGSSSLIA